MTPEQIAELVPRLVTTGVLALVGLSALGFPGSFAAVRPYFSRLNLSGEDRERMNAALGARKAAENIPAWLARAFGVVTLVLAASALVPQIPSIFPYSAWCAAFAAATVIASAHFREAARRRVAVLAPRNPRTALPVPLILAILACVAMEIALALVTPYRAAWAVVALSSVALLVIAGQLAGAPALILGNDVPVERFIDERLRIARTTNVAGLAIAPPIVLLGATHEFSSVGAAAWVVAVAAAAVAGVYLVRAQSVDSQSVLTAMSGRV